MGTPAKAGLSQKLLIHVLDKPYIKLILTHCIGFFFFFKGEKKKKKIAAMYSTMINILVEFKLLINIRSR